QRDSSPCRDGKEPPGHTTATCRKRDAKRVWRMVYQEIAPKCGRLTPIFLHLVRVALLLALSGCATMENMNPIDDLKVASQSVMASMRKQGEKMVRTPEQTKEKYACAPYSK